MKTIATNLKKILLLVLSLASITGIVNAQKSFMFNDIPSLLSERNKEVFSEIILSAESTRTSYNIYYETELELEDWMIDYKFRTDNDPIVKAMPSVFEKESDELELESWMVEPVFPEYLAVDQEDALELEDWMLGQEDWVE
jgi:hypothetical protein